MSDLSPLPSDVVPAGVRARFVADVNGLRMHILEAGAPALAAAGFHVVAPDQRGYGRTAGWSADYDDDLRPFRLLSFLKAHAA